MLNEGRTGWTEFVSPTLLAEEYLKYYTNIIGKNNTLMTLRIKISLKNIKYVISIHKN